MRLSPANWGQHLSHGLGRNGAVAVFSVPDLTLVWCNGLYDRMLDRLYGAHATIGLPLKDFSPLGYETKAQVLREVGESGDPQSGEDMLFSVEQGNVTFRWSVHRPCSGHVAVLVQSDKGFGRRSERARPMGPTKLVSRRRRRPHSASYLA